MASAGAHRRRDGLRQQAAGKGLCSLRGARGRAWRARGAWAEGEGEGVPVRRTACCSGGLESLCLEGGDVAYCNCGNCGGGHCGATAASAAGGSIWLKFGMRPHPRLEALTAGAQRPHSGAYRPQRHRASASAALSIVPHAKLLF